ncbi:MAG: transposase [Armatimonadetes bacterium]|nr:transposase [Armatimonadota bacterium]
MNETKTENGTARKLIKTARRATRRVFTAEDKIRIVMEGIRGDDPVTVVCRREGIHANIYYKWLKDFMEAGKSRLKGEDLRGATKAEVDALKDENSKLRQVVADLSVENLTLKKSLF